MVVLLHYASEMSREPSSSSVLARGCRQQTIGQPLFLPSVPSPLHLLPLLFLISCLLFYQPASCPSLSISALCLPCTTLPPSCLSPRLPYFTPGRGTVKVFPSLSDLLLSPPASPPYCSCVKQLYGPAGTHYQCRTARTGQYCHQVFLNGNNRK